MEEGRFYASNGVELDSIRVTPREMTVAVRQRGDFKYTIEFIGKGGHVLSRSSSNRATYRLTGNEIYVRARVTDSMGSHAWVQPVFVTRR
jgi:hypothetical protein